MGQNDLFSTIKKVTNGSGSSSSLSSEDITAGLSRLTLGSSKVLTGCQQSANFR